MGNYTLAAVKVFVQMSDVVKDNIIVIVTTKLMMQMMLMMTMTKRRMLNADVGGTL